MKILNAKDIAYLRRTLYGACSLDGRWTSDEPQRIKLKEHGLVEMRPTAHLPGFADELCMTTEDGREVLDKVGLYSKS